MRSYFFVVAIMALLLSGCAAHQPRPDPNVPDSATATIAEAAASVSRSLDDLNQMEQAEKPLLTRPTPKGGTFEGLHGVATIDWSGPIEPIVRQIANEAHYRFIRIGQDPAIPVIVTVAARNERLSDILLNIGYQGGQRASVMVYPSRKIIQLRYAGN
ncbi:MAG: type IVB secretion system lipoprotein DotD [Gammaproteobacteria bacterium]